MTNSRADYFKERRKDKKNFGVYIDKNKAKSFDSRLNELNITKTEWLENKIDEELQKGMKFIMEKEITLVTRLSDRDGGNVVGKFLVKMNKDVDLSIAFKNAAEDFSYTKQAQEHLQNISNHITVGDLIQYNPIELYNKYGIISITEIKDQIIEVFIDDNVASYII